MGLKLNNTTCLPDGYVKFIFVFILARHLSNNWPVKPLSIGLFNKTIWALEYFDFTNFINLTYLLMNSVLSKGFLTVFPSPLLRSLVPSAILTIFGVNLLKFHLRAFCS